MKTTLIARDIILFENLAQYDYGSEFIDLHNEFSCMELTFDEGCLCIGFLNDNDLTRVWLRFANVEMVKIEHLVLKTSYDIDLLYRGRYQNDGELVEMKNNKGYFYLDFVDGQHFEFWSSELEVCNGSQ